MRSQPAESATVPMKKIPRRGRARSGRAPVCLVASDSWSRTTLQRLPSPYPFPRPSYSFRWGGQIRSSITRWTCTWASPRLMGGLGTTSSILLHQGLKECIRVPWCLANQFRSYPSSFASDSTEQVCYHSRREGARDGKGLEREKLLILAPVQIYSVTDPKVALTAVVIW